ncbi:MAG: LysR substrate-binding domain-containing protein [Synechocystis sp.]|nr:LysR substrate-binding domain-containing protein [Synechocystis sp.]
MEIYHLKVFLEVARCLSFTEASDALNLTQPAVSAKIKSLESELGTSLFHRLGRRIELTEVGEYLLEEGRYLVEVEAQLLNEIEEMKLGKIGKVKIGYIANTIDYLLPTILFEYNRKYSQVKTQCLQFKSAEQLYRGLKNGEADVGISDLSFAKFEDLSEAAIGSVRYSLMVASTHSLSQRQWLSLKQLQDHPWVLLPEGTPSRTILSHRLNELGLSLKDFSRVEVVDTLSQIQVYLLKGHYLSFMSDFEFQTERQAGWITSIPLEEFAFEMPLFLLMSKRMNRALQNLDQASSRNRRTLDSIGNFVDMVKVNFSLSCHPEARIEGITQQSPPTSAQKVPHFKSPNFSLRSSSSQTSETMTLNIGTQNRTIQTVTAGLIIQRLGLLEHFLPREGRYGKLSYQIQWWDYTSGAPIVAGLESKNIDIGILGDYPLLLSAHPSTNQSPTGQTRLVSFVASNLDGQGNEIIVPDHSSFKSLEDLQGRVIAVPFRSAAHGMLIRSLHHKHLLDNVNLTSIDNFDPRYLTNPTYPVDGYAYFAPFHEIVKHRGGFRRLLQESYNELPTFHGVVVQASLAEQYPEIIVAYLKALIAAQYWYQKTPLASSLVSQWLGLDPAIVTKTLCSLEDRGGGGFFPETHIHRDWLNEHIKQLMAIAGHEYLSQINIEQWVQTEFLETAIATL